MKSKVFFIFFTVLLLFYFCSTPSKIESFLIGNNNYMFFITPEKFESEENEVYADYTVRIQPDKTGNTICNFTLSDINEIEKVYFTIAMDTIPMDSLKLIFRDFELKEIRYSSMISNNNLKLLFQNENINLHVITSKKHEIFKSTTDHKDRINIFGKIITPQF